MTDLADLERRILTADKQRFFQVMKAINVASRESACVRIRKDEKAARVVSALLPTKGDDDACGK
jgi:hypothetical protein